MARLSPVRVEPWANDQWPLVADAQGATDQPLGPATDSHTPTPPPPSSTVAATSGPWTSEAKAMVAVPRAGMVIAAVAVDPEDPTARTVPLTATAAWLTRARVGA